MPAVSTTATSTIARREKRKNASRRSSGAPCQTSATIVARPPIHSDAPVMCTQSATSVSHDEPASRPSWPDTERPAVNAIEPTNAGTSNATRSVSHERKISARTTEKPSVMTMNAWPKRVCVIGDRSP